MEGENINQEKIEVEEEVIIEGSEEDLVPEQDEPSEEDAPTNEQDEGVLTEDKSFNPRSRALREAILKAEGEEGYLVMITTLKGDKLNHTRFTNNFKHGDFMLTLDEYSKMFEKEIQQQ